MRVKALFRRLIKWFDKSRIRPYVLKRQGRIFRDVYKPHIVDLMPAGFLLTECRKKSRKKPVARRKH